MLGSQLDIVLAVIFIILAIVFFMGKGKGVLELFGGKYETQHKRTPDEEREYQRMIGFFMLPLAVVETINIFVDYSMMGLVIAAVAIVDLIIFAKKTKGMH